VFISDVSDWRFDQGREGSTCHVILHKGRGQKHSCWLVLKPRTDPGAIPWVLCRTRYQSLSDAVSQPAPFDKENFTHRSSLRFPRDKETCNLSLKTCAMFTDDQHLQGWQNIPATKPLHRYGRSCGPSTLKKHRHAWTEAIRDYRASQTSASPSMREP
jgi:hypothetical protein